jgi:SPP1 family phage portal protein
MQTHYHGRKKIKIDTDIITADNVVKYLQETLVIHQSNRTACEYLWKYYKGETPVFAKTKEYREGINNIVTEARAMQTVEFYQGYIFGEPVQYNRIGTEDVADDVQWLNRTMKSKQKNALDDELAEFMLVMGVAPRMVLPKKDGVFDIYNLDPRSAYVAHYNDLGEKPVMCVKCVEKSDNTTVYAIYTKDRYFEVVADAVQVEKPHTMGDVPMREYCLNNVRMGIFEPGLTIMDAIDNLQSNRMDDIQQFVNSILAIIGAELTEETLNKLQEYGAMSLPDGTDAKYLNAALSQADIQTLKNDLLSAYTEITGMPNRNGGSSTSDTGSAVLLRDGWEIADAKAKRIETQFKKAEREILGLILSFAKHSGIDMDHEDVDIKFTRRNYENIQTKSQVLSGMLASDKIAPRLAFLHCGMFPDPEQAYMESMEWYESNKQPPQTEEPEGGTE